MVSVRKKFDKNYEKKLYTKPISGDESKSPIKIDSKDITDMMSKLTKAINTIKK